MGSLVLELQNEVLDPSVSALNLLRKSLIVATKLKLQDFKKWIEFEINGYKDRQTIPEYRSVQGEIKCRSPYYGWQTIPSIFDSSTEDLKVRYLHQPISELEKLINSPSNTLIIKYGAELEKAIMDCFNLDVQPTIHITKASVCRVLEAVRDTILRWTLDLEENGILGEGMTFSSNEKESATQHNFKLTNYITMIQEQKSTQVNNNYYSPIGSLQNGDHNTANVNQTIGSNNQEILKDIAELRKQITTSTLPPNLQEVADDALDTLQEEIISPTSKPAKIKAAWMNICTVIGKAKDPRDMVTNKIPAIILRKYIQQFTRNVNGRSKGNI
jgi:hypothetical protein